MRKTTKTSISKRCYLMEEKTQGLKIHFPVIFKEQRTNPNVLRCLKYLSKKIAFTYVFQGWTKELKNERTKEMKT